MYSLIITCTQYVLYVTLNTQVPRLTLENLNVVLHLFSFKLEKPVTLQIQIGCLLSSEVRLIFNLCSYISASMSGRAKASEAR